MDQLSRLVPHIEVAIDAQREHELHFSTTRRGITGNEAAKKVLSAIGIPADGTPTAQPAGAILHTIGQAANYCDRPMAVFPVGGILIGKIPAAG